MRICVHAVLFFLDDVNRRKTPSDFPEVSTWFGDTVSLQYSTIIDDSIVRPVDMHKFGGFEIGKTPPQSHFSWSPLLNWSRWYNLSALIMSYKWCSALVDTCRFIRWTPVQSSVLRFVGTFNMSVTSYRYSTENFSFESFSHFKTRCSPGSGPWVAGSEAHDGLSSGLPTKNEGNVI